MSYQPDLFDARQARDEAMGRVLSNAGGPWMSQYLEAIAALPMGFAATGEEIRLRLVAEGLTPPHHWNAWGPALKVAVRRGFLRDTGTIRNMRTTKSHARRSPVWVRR